MMKSLRTRQAHADDLTHIESINSRFQKKDPYPDFNIMRSAFRTLPFLSVMKFEKKQLFSMFCLHAADITVSLFGIYLAMQILLTFETTSLLQFKLITLFFHNPTLSNKFLFAFVLAILVFCLNVVAASLHANKIEREMLLEWRVPMKITQAVYHFVLNMSARSREKYQTGDITNIVQSDAHYIGGLLAHALVDFAVILVACILVTAFMLQIVGSPAWFAVIVMLAQIPISFFFAWLSVKFHERRMEYSDKRVHMVTEFIQGMRLLRYLGWTSHFEKEMRTVTNREFVQDIKMTTVFNTSFSIIYNLWMFISAAVFAGYLMIYHNLRDASVLFGIIWIAKLFAQQVGPLPWFLHIFSQTIVASKRIRLFFQSQTQEEEFAQDAAVKPLDDTRKSRDTVIPRFDRGIQSDTTATQSTEDTPISFEFDHVSFQYLENGPLILDDISFSIKANQTLAIVGQVGSGKSTLLKILIGEYKPTKGVVYICMQTKDKTIKLNLHTPEGLKLLRSVQSYVPQESFIVTSTIRENVVFEYDVPKANENYDRLVMNALFRASLMQDLSQFPDQLETEIGERGVNLSGGQKQRLSLARKFYKNSKVVIMDDPFSAVDTKTETEIVSNIFSSSNKSQKTIVWTTHRLSHLRVSDVVLYLDKGQLVGK